MPVAALAYDAFEASAPTLTGFLAPPRVRGPVDLPLIGREVARLRTVASPVAPAELVGPAVAGDKAAMRELLVALTPAVLSTARRILRHSHDAEEAAQETLIVLVRDLGTLREAAAVVAFARRATSRVAMRLRRRRERTEGIEPASSDIPSSVDATPATQSMERERAEILLGHLDALPEAQSEALVMQFVLGFTPAEIAAASQTPVNTVRSRIRLGRAALATRLLADPRFERRSGGTQ